MRQHGLAPGFIAADSSHRGVAELWGVRGPGREQGLGKAGFTDCRGRELAPRPPPQDGRGCTHPKPVPVPQCQPASWHWTKLPVCPGPWLLSPRAAVFWLVREQQQRAEQGVHWDWHGNGALSWGWWHPPHCRGAGHAQHTSVGLTRMREDAQSPLSQKPGQTM